MNAVICNNCGCSDGVRLDKFPLEREQQDAWLVRCSLCNLVYLNPRPAKDAIGFYYPPNYQADMLRLLAAAKTSWAARIGFDMVRRRRTPVLKNGGRLLDLGCSNGAYLAALREQGWDVEGVELDSEAAGYAREARGLKVTEGDAESVLAELRGNSFDVITMWHLLEHLFDPGGALKQIHRILKPGGILMLEVPNYGSPLASVFRRYWFPLDIPRHLYHFTTPTLRALMTKAGLDVLQVKGVPSPEAIVWSLSALRKRAPIDFNKGYTLPFNPVGMSLAFPVSWTMAQFGLSDTMSVVAVRGNAAGNQAPAGNEHRIN